MIRVASFNVKNLSLGKDENSDKKRDIERIANLIKKFDIVVLQEVLTPKVIEGFLFNSNSPTKGSLLEFLGTKWRGIWVDPQTESKFYPYLGQDKRGEGYGFLWNTRKVNLVRDDEENEILPKRYSDYRTDARQLRMMRDPGYGRFKLVNRPVEIRVITTHIIFGKPKEENLSVETDLGAIGMRRSEFNLLAGKIYKNINDYHKDTNFNASYTIIMGDYNLNLPGDVFTNAIIPEICCYDSKGKLCENGDNVMITVQKEPTTLKSDYSDYANNFDHCTYNNKISSIIKECVRVEAIDDMDDPKKVKEYFDTVSDHVPIFVEINC